MTAHDASRRGGGPLPSGDRSAERDLPRSSHHAHGNFTGRSWGGGSLAIIPDAGDRVEPPKPVTLVHSKEHPVLSDAVSWGVESVRIEVARKSPAAGRAWLVLRRGRETIRLRFDGVTDLAMRPGFLDTTVAVRILDVSHLLWQHVTVRVESACGTLGFWAAAAAVEKGLAAEARPAPSARRRTTRRGRSGP